MWEGAGHAVSDGVNAVLDGFRFGKVDHLICEHLQYCGALNTVRSTNLNIYDSLGCNPVNEIRIPNWNDMHIFDAETAIHDPVGYAALNHTEKVRHIQVKTARHKARFLSHCRGCSFPQLESWTDEHWLTTRLGWSSNHPTLTMTNKMFALAAEKMDLPLSDKFKTSSVYTLDRYAPTGYALTPVDYDANNWKF
jgi:hypothetical protein